MIIAAIAGLVSVTAFGEWYRNNKQRKLYSGNIRYSQLPGNLTWSPQMVGHAHRANFAFLIFVIAFIFFLSAFVPNL
jgi:hypothetical protein